MKTMLRRLLPFVLRQSDADAGSILQPMPIIVGSPRSGTTLLRFMLDAHPDLAIPPETGFLSLADAWSEAGGDAARRVFEDIIAFPSEAPVWNDFHLSAETYADEIAMLKPRSASEAVRLFYRMYAARFGKPRWGDKTPLYCRSMVSIEKLLPEAHFIHLIRDGRDVALSLRSRFFSPGHDIETQARYWRDNVESARNARNQCRHYLEIRYEDLLRNTEAVLRRVCAFIGLRFAPEMLTYYECTPDRLKEHLTRYRTDGSVIISHEDRLRQQAGTMIPPDSSRIGVWRREMDLDEARRFQNVASVLLDELGYPLLP
jgi:hypothetical protein